MNFLNKIGLYTAKQRHELLEEIENLKAGLKAAHNGKNVIYAENTEIRDLRIHGSLTLLGTHILFHSNIITSMEDNTNE